MNCLVAYSPLRYLSDAGITRTFAARIRLINRIVSGSCSFRRESRSTETGLRSVSWKGDVVSDAVFGAQRGRRRGRVFEQREARRTTVLFASAIVAKSAPAPRNTRTNEG